MSAVCPRRGSFACRSAPRVRSTRTASTLPVRAAVISIVSPPGSDAFASAPASRNFVMMAALPFSQAIDSGVTPYRFVARTSAPAASNRLTRSTIVVIGRPVKCRRAVRLRRVDAGFLVEQLANGGAIVPLHGGSERRVRSRRALRRTSWPAARAGHCTQPAKRRQPAAHHVCDYACTVALLSLPG